MVRIFDVNNGVVIPSEHCLNLKTFKAIIDNYPKDHMKILSYVYYMKAPDPMNNPFFDVPESDKEEMIIKELDIDFSLDEYDINEALALAEKLYETPTYRAYMGIKKMLDNIADYMGNTTITDGRDGNLTSIITAGSRFKDLREAFKSTYSDLVKEQNIEVRGSQTLAYDEDI